MRRRLLIIIGSLTTAAVATAVIVTTATRERDDALAVTRAASVLIATERIDPGTPASEVQDRVVRAEIPQSALVPGVLTGLDTVADLRTIGSIFPGQQIIAAQWGEVPTSPLQPPAGTLGIAVQLGDPQRVAGFATPGSKVALFVTLSDTTGMQRTRLLLSPIMVLGVGGSTVTTRTVEQDGATSTEQVPSAVLTLALTPEQAERVVFATTEGQVHLGLLGDRVKPATGEGVTAASLFGVLP